MRDNLVSKSQKRSKMVDYKKLRFSIECPKCKSKIKGTVLDIAMESKFKCHDCGTKIRFKDEGGSIKNSMDNMQHSMEKVEANVLGYLKSRT